MTECGSDHKRGYVQCGTLRRGGQMCQLPATMHVQKARGCYLACVQCAAAAVRFSGAVVERFAAVDLSGYRRERTGDDDGRDHRQGEPEAQTGGGGDERPD